MLNNKRGSPSDMALLLVISFTVFVSIFVVLYVNTILSRVISTTELNSTAAYSSINESFGYINSFVIQRGVVLFFGLLCLGLFISSFLVRAHPIFLFIYMITLGITILVSMYLANAYELIVTNPELSSVASNYTMVTFIMQHIATILLSVGVMTFILLLARYNTAGVGDL